MSEETTRFRFPFILPGQAQKEAFHNEALEAVDGALHPSVAGPPMAEPPAAPVSGQGWIVGGQATGAWSGKEGMIARWTAGGWRFTAPVPGMRAWLETGGLWLHWTGTGWSGGEVPAARIVIEGQQIVGPRLPEVPSPSGGTTIDQEARAAIDTLIATLKSHGLTD
ncbi:MAG: DUF2793 domain-containing protein [Allosphingosinicella sp.]|uniref:DUF2793 domain-containing protein n=1 Tax=Allosphingosinicella sp. TaxID=2823234 RepID=UPI003953E8EC